MHAKWIKLDRANFEELTLICKEIEDSFMCREPYVNNILKGQLESTNSTN